MSTASRTKWVWPPDVLDYASRHQVSQYLEPLLEMTQRLFPGASSVRVFAEQDVEARNDEWIVFEVTTPEAELPDFVAAVNRWNAEARQVCPSVLIHHFVLTLLST